MLDQILQEAVEDGASSIELEYADGGLEICFMHGSSGLGHIVEDQQIIDTLMSEGVKRAKLENRTQGSFKTEIAGHPWKITVEEYDTFGESSFRLNLKQTK